MNRRSDRRRFMRWGIPLLCLLLLAGCSSTWRAPVSSRSGEVADKRLKIKPAVTKSSINGSYYRVRRGDTLFSIAWRSGNDYRQLARWNRIYYPYRIYAGQRLRIKPPAANSPASKSTRKPSPASKTTKTHQSTASRSTGHKQAKRSSTLSSSRRLHWAWPYRGKLLQTYSARDETRKGIKLAGKRGVSIRAAEAGKVVYSGSGLRGYGKLIIVKHNKDYLSAYGHNDKLLVREGDQVTKGQRIALMGVAEAGKPMLHFEIRRNGKPVDPLRLLPR